MSPSNNVVNIQVQPTENKPKMQCCQNIQPSHGSAATAPPPTSQSLPPCPPSLPLCLCSSYPSSKPLKPCPQKIDCLGVLCGVGGTSHSLKAVTRTLHLPVPASFSFLSQVNKSQYKKKSPPGVTPLSRAPLSLGYCRTAGISYHFRFHYRRCADMSQICLNI